ncbi:MAG: DNA mismatch repair endonuclease MutL [Acidobacteriota bacterium]|nr:DNA mismatch repair endonuclease MutL [Acidobacteriota bacterium]
MNRIALLPPEVARKIAAGEVIERPVSVVKELVENSLDAGASEIAVELANGGKSMLAVRDDGQGMSRRDAELCFERHSTSKISREDDLAAISTLGFRGEALASIAAVSRLTLKTSEGGAEAGTRVDIEGGGKPSVSSIAFPRGAAIEVRDLFFNLPARRKFLQGDTAELGQIVKYLTGVALAYPKLRLSAVHGTRSVLSCPPVEGLRERIFQLYGRAALDGLMEVEFTESGMRLSGLASRPPAGRSNRTHQLFFVNKRPVRDKILSSALNQAYRGFLEKDRAPEAFLFLTVPPGEVDVNVHPAKSEVRFRASTPIFQLVLRAVDKSRRQAGGVKAVAVPRPEAPAGEPEMVAYIPGEPFPGEDLPFRVADTGPVAAGGAGGLAGETDGPPELRVLGQYADAYIIAADADGLLVVDQHNAHERILYDRYAEIDRGRSWPVQTALIPLVFEASPSQAVALDAGRALLEESGFRVEPMGGRSYALREYPDVFGPQEALVAFLALLEDVRTRKAEERKSRVLATMACKTAIKAGERLPREKMEFLVRELFRTSNPAVCPHGRPIVVRLDRAAFERGLGRR